MEQQSSAPKPVRSLVNFLRSSSGPKTKVGLLNGKRHDYFKGTGAVKALLSPAYKKAASAKNAGLPAVETEQQAEELLHSVIPFAFFLRVDRATVSSKEGRPLQINQMQMFKSELVRGCRGAAGKEEEDRGKRDDCNVTRTRHG